MRQKLVQAIKEVFHTPDIQFYQGFLPISGSLQDIQYPCVWLCPVELSKRADSRTDVCVYKVTLHYLYRWEQAGEELKEQVWTAQELYAQNGFERIADHPDVNYPSNLKCEPAEAAVSPGVEISMKVTFEANVPFCEE